MRLAALAIVFVVAEPSARAQGERSESRSESARQDKESREVFLCPFHRDVQTLAPDACPVCGRPLEKKRVRVVWACPMHPSLKRAEGSVCPACGMAVAPITVEVQPVCPDAGPCDEPLEEREVPMPHGDHNARHGGVFFMAPDGFHHVEGTLSASGTFRLYLYDNFTRPLDARAFRARVDEQLLSATEEGEALEITLAGPLASPPDVTLFLQFPAGREERFDFVFFAETTTLPATPIEIPNDPHRLIEGIFACARKLDALIRRGAWAELYIPAMEAKTLALVLEEKGLPVKKIVRAAWLLDMYGDLGNRPKVEEAYALFRLGIAELQKPNDK